MWLTAVTTGLVLTAAAALAVAAEGPPSAPLAAAWGVVCSDAGAGAYEAFPDVCRTASVNCCACSTRATAT